MKGNLAQSLKQAPLLLIALAYCLPYLLAFGLLYLVLGCDMATYDRRQVHRHEQTQVQVRRGFGGGE